jgi:hypothetical protein
MARPDGKSGALPCANATMTFPEFGDTVSAAAFAADGSCHVTIA